ncbi:glycosyltransferase family 4 protein [Mesonia mobilis]|uniref:glycosyltransferase family 4 protein n=1 Tax=Mesonia mobilis TaxID=369791 RepID=UPI0024B990CE|nr:glycosyltransferase family 4 protein [Mesonia mobilis]
MPNTKIKVLYTIPNFDTAGSGKVVYDLVKSLDASRFEPAIAVEHSKGHFFKEVEQLGVTIYIQPVSASYRPYLSLYRRIKKIASFIKKHQFDVVHSWHWSSDWTEVLGAKLGGAKFVYTKKAMSWGNKHWKIRSYLSDFIVTINPEMKSFFPYKKQQKLIPLGIDTSYYNPKLFKKNQDTDNFEIVTVANLVPVKGIETLIGAIKELADNSIILKIIGDTRNPYADQLKKLSVSLNLEKQIFFLGNKNDIRPYVANADLYVIPTLDIGRKEGFGVALIEAMSLGVPVLGSKTSGIKYILEDYQEHLFKPGDIKDLGIKIIHVKSKSNSEREKIGLEFRKFCKKNFSIEKFIEEHEDLYQKLVDR